MGTNRVIKLLVHETEVHAYVHIKKELIEKKGWKRNQIFTQNEVRKIELIAKQLAGKTPENVVKINENQYYVIEAKSKQKLLKQAIKEAKEEYADLINKSDQVEARFVTGIAGNDDEGFIAISKFLQNGKWVIVKENGTDVTSLLSNEQIKRILGTNDPDLKNIEISEKEFLKTAEDINKMLHKNSIPKDQRAKNIAAILLALWEGTEINLNESAKLLIQSINNRVELVLKKHNRVEFAPYASWDLPASSDNHTKYKTAIVKTIQTLRGLNINSMMKSGKDLLGAFYEVFLKYGNGAKDLGIVLTPRHITQFAAQILDVQHTDLVFDPTYGTGGFLIAAFDEVRKKATPEQFDTFKRCGLYGIEQTDAVVTLALVNMIFRDDGKSNIISGNCFANWLDTTKKDGEIIAKYSKENKDGRIPPITKVLMNPPFALRADDEMEYKFIRHALKQMQKGGLLFSVLPVSTLLESGEKKEWRKNELLKENTLLSVITFHPQLFYGSGTNVHSLGIIIKKGIPHPPNQNVLWIKIRNDGYIKVKRKRIKSEKIPDELEIVKETIKKIH